MVLGWLFLVHLVILKFKNLVGMQNFNYRSYNMEPIKCTSMQFIDNSTDRLILSIPRPSDAAQERE
jgi:hypothetical protein